ncbi:MAG: DUF6020 family protein [Anaerorhabdus sp.]
MSQSAGYFLVKNSMDLTKLLFLTIYSFFFSLIITFSILIFFKHNKDSVEIINISHKKKINIMMFFVLVTCWLPTLFAYYPGIWSYDVGTQINQLLTDSVSKYQPIIHTMLVSGVLWLSNFLKSYEKAIFVYSFLQLIILACSFVALNNFLLKKFKLKKYVIAIVLIFQCLMPFNSIMAISSTKDTLFSALTVLMIINIYEFLEVKDGNSWKWYNYLYFGGITALWISFRNNALFVILPLVLISFVLFRKNLRKIMICFATTLVVVLGFNFLLDSFIKPQTYSSVEILSVPINQISKTMLNDDIKLTPNSKRTFDSIFGDSYKNYNPHLSDPVKSKLNFKVSDMGSFVSLWIELLPKYFNDYVTTFLNLNRGSWYLFDESYARIYIDKYYEGVLIENDLGDKQQGYLQTSLEQIIPVEYDSKIPGLFSFYENIVSKNQFMNNIFLKILFSPALYVWIMIASVFMSFYRKNNIFKIVTLLPFLYWLTTLLGPCTLVRYIYPIIIMLPLYLCILTCEIRKEGEISGKEN